MDHKIWRGGGRPPDVYICESSFLCNEDQFLGVAFVKPDGSGRTLTDMHTSMHTPQTWAVPDPIFISVYLHKRTWPSPDILYIWHCGGISLPVLQCLLTVFSTLQRLLLFQAYRGSRRVKTYATQSLWSETLVVGGFNACALIHNAANISNNLETA